MESDVSHSKHESPWYYVFLTLAIIYVAGITFTNFADWDAIWAFLGQNFGSTPQNSAFLNLFYNVRLTNNIIYPGIGKVFFFGLMLCGLWAGFGLSKGRNFIEAVCLFLFYTIPRPNYFWGKISDKASGAVVPFAKIEIRKLDPSSNTEVFLTQTISDLFGRYRISFGAEPGFIYTVQVLASDYKVFSKTITRVTSQNVTIYSDIELSPLNQEESKASRVWFNLRTRLNNNIALILYLISIVSLIVMTSGLLQSVQSWTVFYFGIALSAFLWNSYIFFVYNRQHTGRFILIESGQPAADLLVNLLSAGRKVASAITSKEGDVSFGVEPGEYELQILTQGVKLALDDKEISGKPALVKVTDKGFLSHNVYVRRVLAGMEANLINPFA